MWGGGGGGGTARALARALRRRRAAGAAGGEQAAAGGRAAGPARCPRAAGPGRLASPAAAEVAQRGVGSPAPSRQSRSEQPPAGLRPPGASGSPPAAAPRPRRPAWARRPGRGPPVLRPRPGGCPAAAAAAAWPPAAACWAGPRPLFSRGRGVRACGCAQRPVLARLPCLRAGKAEPAPPQPGGPRAPAGPAGLAARPAALPGETFPPATSSASPSAQRSLSPRPKIALGAVTQGAARRCRGLGAVGGRAAAGRRVGARDAWESRAVRWQSGCGERYSRRWSWPVSAPSAGFSHLCSLTNSYSTKRVGSCMFLIPICNETGIGARC